jgi:hypothetical protein
MDAEGKAALAEKKSLGRNGLMRLSLIGVSCLEEGALG